MVPLKEQNIPIKQFVNLYKLFVNKLQESYVNAKMKPYINVFLCLKGRWDLTLLCLFG